MNRSDGLMKKIAAVFVLAFLVTQGVAWLVCGCIAKRDAHKAIEIAFNDVGSAICEKVNRLMVHQAMVFRDRLPALRASPMWKEPEKCVPMLRSLADELVVDELCVADRNGILTHSATKDDIGFDYKNLKGQAKEFLALLNTVTEVTQSFEPNTRAGQVVKYVGVWMPEGGFVQVGCREPKMERLAMTSLVGLTHDRHVKGDAGYIAITTATGAVISHTEEANEGGQWVDPGDDSYWDKREIEGFTVYVVLPKKAVLEDRIALLCLTAVANAMLLVLASLLAKFTLLKR